MAPLIGVTCDYDVKRNVREVACLYPDYFEAVEQAGGVPVLIPPIRSIYLMRSLLDRLDGVVLSGCDDYNPKLWGDKPHPSWTPMMPRREAFDLKFASLLLETGLPILGICGGMQLINISLGGTLIQHIPEELNGAVQVEHTKPAPEFAVHEVEIVPGSVMNESESEPKEVQVRSYHHQAIRELAPSLKVTGTSRDGLIEMVEGDTPNRFLLGVQWHPEKHLPEAGPDRDFHLELFRKLVDAATQRGNRAPVS